MTTATIRTAAMWAYAAYHQGRPGRSWDREGNAVQIRWERCAARVLNGQITTARQLRDAYHAEYFGVKEWSAVSVHDRRRWGDVLRAIQKAGDLEKAA